MLLDELATYLQTTGVGVVGTTIFKGTIPLAGPDALLALVEVPGMAPVLTHDHTRYEQPVIQCVIRGAPHAYETARVTAQAAWAALDGVSNEALSGVDYLWITALQSVWYLRTDAFHRPHLVFTVRVARALG
jgi:hypothetical protein